MTTPPFFHWYVGALPPFVGLAVKVTDVSAHTDVPVLVVTLTEGVTRALTVIILWALVAVVGDAQLALLVRTTHTLSPLARAALTYVVAFVPTADPFLYH